MAKKIQFLNVKEISRIKSSYKKIDLLREEIIKISRDIQKSSKIAIYNLQRDNIKEAEKLFSEIEKNISLIKKKASNTKALEHTGSFTASLEEYVEGKTFYAFLKKKSFPTAKELQVSEDTYINGLSDLTGELVRLGINYGIQEKYEELIDIRDAISQIYGALLEFDFRNGTSRKKFDAIKYNVQKIEDLILSISLKQN